MRWHFRKHRKKYEDTEDVEYKEPKKSILRSKGRDSYALEELNGIDSELSMVDLRNTSASGSETRDTNKTQGTAKFQSTQSLRSLDGTRDSERSRRSVLFLDEVLTRKKQVEDNTPSIGSPASLRTGTPTSGNFSTFASYPPSYQPSPVLCKREADNKIELISRSPLPRMRGSSESAADIWSVSSYGKDSSRRIPSLTRHRKQKNRISNEPFVDQSTGRLESTNNTTSYDALARYNSTQSGLGSMSSAMAKEQFGRNNTSGALSNRTASLGANNSEHEDPIVKRPSYPRVIEPRIRLVKQQEYNSDQKHTDHGIVLVASNTNLTDSNVTLRPDCSSSASLETVTDRPGRRSSITDRHVNGTMTDQGSPDMSGTEFSMHSLSPPPIPIRHSSITRNDRLVQNKTVKQAPAYRTIEVYLPTRRTATDKPPLPSAVGRTQCHQTRSVASSPESSPRILTVTHPQAAASGNSSPSLSNFVSKSNKMVRVISITRSC